jgi:hypothetical protein
MVQLVVSGGEVPGIHRMQPPIVWPPLSTAQQAVIVPRLQHATQDTNSKWVVNEGRGPCGSTSMQAVARSKGQHF